MRVVIALLAVGALVGAALPAQAENRPLEFRGLGPRVGVSINPDQFVFGGHADLGDPFPSTNLLFPVLEIGFGDDFTVASIGADLLFRLKNSWGDWRPFVGPELALIVVNVDLPNGDSATNTDLGLQGVFGVEKAIGDNNKFGLEIKFEIVDAPDVKFVTHWTFGH